MSVTSDCDVECSVEAYSERKDDYQDGNIMDEKDKHNSLARNISRMIDQKVDKEELILQIKAYPALWDTRDEGYVNKRDRQGAWDKVIAHFFEDFEDMSDYEKLLIGTNLQKIWRNIRICYSRELRKTEDAKHKYGTKSHKKYVYFEQLKFLETTSKKLSSSLGAIEESYVHGDGYEDAVNIEWNKRKSHEIDEETVGCLDRQNKCNRHGKNKMLEVLSEKSLSDKSKELEKIDEDKLFFLSLLSEVHKVPSENKLRLRSDIIAAIANAQVPNQQIWVPTQDAQNNLQKYHSQKTNTTVVSKNKPHKNATHLNQ